MNNQLNNYLLSQGLDPREYIVLGVAPLSENQLPLCTATKLVKFTEMARSVIGICSAVLERQLDERLYFGFGVCFLRMKPDLIGSLADGVAVLSAEIPHIAEWLGSWQRAGVSRHPDDIADLKAMEASFGNPDLVARLKKFAKEHATSKTRTIAFLDEKGKSCHFELPPLAQLNELDMDGTPAIEPSAKEIVREFGSMIDIASNAGDAFLVRAKSAQGQILPGMRVRLTFPSAPRKLRRISRLRKRK